MEVIRWDRFWEDYKTEFEQEVNLPGGALGEQAAEDLRQRVIEHVRILFWSLLGLLGRAMTDFWLKSYDYLV